MNDNTNSADGSGFKMMRPLVGIALATAALAVTFHAGFLVGLPTLLAAGFLTGAVGPRPNFDRYKRDMYLQLLGPLLIPVSMGLLVVTEHVAEQMLHPQSIDDIAVVISIVLMVASTYVVGLVTARLVRHFFF